MAVEAQAVRRLPHERIVRGSMRVVASEAGNAVRVHGASDVVITLHAILSSSAVGKVSERGLSQLGLF